MPTNQLPHAQHPASFFSKLRSRSNLVCILFLSVGLFAACRSQPEQITVEVTRLVPQVVTVPAEPVEVTRIVRQTVEVTAVPTPTPVETTEKELVVCLTHEPASLYLYQRVPAGTPALARQAIFHAIYENLYTTLSFEYQAQGIVKMPNIADGDAEIVSTAVQEGDAVLNVDGDVVTLREGVTVLDSEGIEVVFDGKPVRMAQMVVRFELEPMRWSDGAPVTAADSVFSFHIAADLDTPGDKSRIERTAEYVALDELTLQWTGVPGWLDPTYFTNLWTPLPAHQLSGYTAAELLTTPETAVTPLSNGPFVVTAWLPGDRITLIKNEQYYRLDEGFPRVDAVTFRFVENANQLLSMLLAGTCDIGTQDSLGVNQLPFLLDAEAAGLLAPDIQASTLVEHIALGINPEEDYAKTRPDWFEDARVRQAVTMCTDRQGMVESLFSGRSEVAYAYTPATHPVYPSDLTEWPYDVAAANTLLDQANYRDLDRDGTRQDPITKTPFHITLGIDTDNELRLRAAQMFAEDMADCGIEVELLPRPAVDWFSPEGPLFRRRFDLVQFPWLTGLTPSCGLYLTAAIPSAGNGWLGNNVTGWANPAFDDACGAALTSFFGAEPYVTHHQEALRLFTEAMPAIPLFWHPKIAASRPEVRHFAPNVTQASELWNLYEIDLNR